MQQIRPGDEAGNTPVAHYWHTFNMVDGEQPSDLAYVSVFGHGHKRARNDIAWRPILRLQTGVQIVIEWLTAGCQLHQLTMPTGVPSLSTTGTALIRLSSNSRAMSRVDWPGR
jgi:hypothetical protein